MKRGNTSIRRAMCCSFRLSQLISDRDHMAGGTGNEAEYKNAIDARPVSGHPGPHGRGWRCGRASGCSRAAGQGGRRRYAGDERDGDILPSVAYDPVTRRYLVVWATPRHAGGEGDGLDVYGTFLDLEGRPINSEFRISDRNTVARIGGPAVVNAGPGRFLVLWTQRRPCRLAAQIVTNRGARPDVLLLSDSLPLHSVDVVYVPTSNRFVMTYVRGDDYQTPRIFGASTAHCGNQPESTSRIEAARFAWINNAPVFTERVNVTTDHGAFRPRLARHAATGKILIAWEDRRDAIEQPYRFDVYSQILSDGLAPLGGSFVLQSGSYYFNDDESATWTPRPVVAAAGRAAFWRPGSIMRLRREAINGWPMRRKSVIQGLANPAF